MIARRVTSGPLVALTVCLAVTTVAAWRWRIAVLHAPRGTIGGESWDRLRTDYPMRSEVPNAASLSQEVVDAVLLANPFSPQRRLAPPSAGEHSAPAGSSGIPAFPPAPQFRYKGRVNLGSRQRAVVEDAAAGKTYFLEVGQEVAGFKVLDIGESRVVLSDLKTRKEVVVSLASPETP